MIFSRYKRLGDDPDAIPPPPFGMPEDQYSPMPDGSPDYGTPPSDQNLGTTGGTATGPAAQISQQPDPAPSMRADSMDAAKGIKPIAGPPQPPPGLNAPQLNTGGDAPDDPATFAPPSPPPGIQGAPLPPLSKAQQYQNQYDALKAPEKPKPGIWQKLAAAGLGATAGFSNVNPRNNHIDASGAEQALLLGPKYMRDQAQYEQSKGDLQNKIKLADDVENIASKSENRLASAANRKLSIENAATAKADALKQQQQGLNEKLLALSKDGINRVPANTPPLTPEEKAAGIEEREDVFGDPKYKTRVNAMNGMVRLPDDVAAKFTLPKGLPVHIDKLIDLAKTAYTADNKPDKAEQENVAHWIAVAEDPNASPQDKAIANAKIKRNQENLSQVHIHNAAAAQPMNDAYIQAVANYEADPPSPRSSNYQQVIGAAKALNPKWDIRAAGAGKRALNQFTSGKTADAIDAINTVSGHLKTLDDAATALKNNDVAALNRMGNALGVQFGTGAGRAVAMYNTIVHRVGPELGKAYGTATEGENNLNQSDFDASKGPDLIHGAIGVSAGLLNGKINALKNRWEKTIPGRDFDLITPEAQQVFNTLGGGKRGGGNQNNGGGRQGGGPPPAQQGGVIVQTPHGPMTFKDQATANAYKLAAGIK